MYFVKEDELEKLRSALLHSYDKRKPLARRLIEALRNRSQTEKKVTRLKTGRKGDKDAA
jgi:hypothetical protein